ncbi:MAG: hypothetical protein FWC32_12950 [Firmicutes bacterium]|nr:hypothetical protein [Bacillota bacterium]
MEAIQQAILQIDLRAASDWQGRAAAQNVENFQTLNDMTTDYLVDAYGTKNALDLAITAYETTEQGQVAKVQNLSVQGIFS